MALRFGEAKCGAVLASDLALAFGVEQLIGLPASEAIRFGVSAVLALTTFAPPPAHGALSRSTW